MHSFHSGYATGHGPGSVPSVQLFIDGSDIKEWAGTIKRVHVEHYPGGFGKALCSQSEVGLHSYVISRRRTAGTLAHAFTDRPYAELSGPINYEVVAYGSCTVPLTSVTSPGGNPYVRPSRFGGATAHNIAGNAAGTFVFGARGSGTTVFTIFSP